MKKDTAAKDTTPSTPKKKRTSKARKKLNPETVLPMEDGQLSIAFISAAESKESGKTVTPAVVSNALSSSPAVTQVFDQFKYTGRAPDSKVSGKAALKTKIVLDTDTVRLDTFAQFTEFDRAVLEAVFAQLSAGNVIMSPGMIYRSMTGKEAGVYVSPEMASAINESIEKCMYGSVTIPTFNAKTNQPVTLDSAILNIIRATYSISGHLTQAYEIQSAPILYTYCKSIGALTCSPIEMNNTPLNSTKRSVALTNYLQRVVVPKIFDANGNCMLAPKCENCEEGSCLPHNFAWLEPERILYADLYKTVSSLDGSEITKFLARKIRTMVQCVLDCWVESGYIKRWAIVNDGRNTYYGIDIFFHPVVKSFLPATEMSQILPRLETNH